jgi:hypothetical protein
MHVVQRAKRRVKRIALNPFPKFIYQAPNVHQGTRKTERESVIPTGLIPLEVNLRNTEIKSLDRPNLPAT